MDNHKTCLEDNPFWYRNAIIYQVHVKGFKDLNGNGTGDFKGLTSKLDYLEALGVTAIWLLPFYPSPLKDDGYDIADYFAIHPKYGTLRDFRRFLAAAHKRGLRVITELVINHTSDQHPWFQRARQAPSGSSWRNYYVWSDTPEKYQDARIIFKDFETSNWMWDPVAKAYFWHRFYAHQPDLNFDHPPVHREIFKVVDFWLEMGVDGLRLDAIPYLYQREGTNCENLPETHVFLKRLRQHVDAKFKNRMLLAEANQWPEDAIAYFGSGDECHMSFHFPLMPRLYMALRMEDRFPIVDILEQTPPLPANCQWAMFLRNHDELTLEMVSDEERDYMYHMYASDPSARINLGIRRRLAPLLENDRRKIQLLNVLLLSLPGTPVIYYGDEIGMGDNYYLGDRNGVRTPMQWGSDHNAGFSNANPQKLYLPLIIDPEYHYEVVNVENQERNPASLLWWMRRVLFGRKKYPAFGLGTLEFILPDNHKVLAFVRAYQDTAILIVVNLSRFSQAAELDLSKYRGCTPLELSNQNPFPQIGEAPYNITLGPYGYFSLALKQSESLSSQRQIAVPAQLAVSGSWDAILRGKALEALEKTILPAFLLTCPWFGRKTATSATLQKVRLTKMIPLGKAWILFIEATFSEEQWTDTYVLPVSFRASEQNPFSAEEQKAVIATLVVNTTKGYLYDALYDPAFRQALLVLISDQRRLAFSQGELQGRHSGDFQLSAAAVTTHFVKSEQSNTSIQYDQTFFFTFYRRLDDGLNPDVDMIEFLSERCHFAHVPAYRGKLTWKHTGGATAALALLEAYVQNQGSAWDYTWEALSRYSEYIMSHREELEQELKNKGHEDVLMQDLIGSYAEMASLLGLRTAQMHSALCSERVNPDFSPQPCGQLYRRATYQAVRVAIRRIFILLKSHCPRLPANVQLQTRDILNQEALILTILQRLLEPQAEAWRIRIHGDYHLKQILFTGKDICIVDFEGQAERTLNVRRSKRLALQDVAGMLYSFQSVAYAHLFSGQMLKPEQIPLLAPWIERWYRGAGKIFLDSYTVAINQAYPALLPQPQEACRALLQTWIVKKAVYEIGYNLRYNSEKVAIALTVLQELLKTHTV